MKVLFISYWGIEEGLTQATVIPNVMILATIQQVEKIYLFTIERSRTKRKSKRHIRIRKVEHISYSSANTFRDKLWDFSSIPWKLIKMVREKSIDLIICRSSLAGAIGLTVNKRTGVPFIVESFEPHSDYMVEAGIWKKSGIRNRLQKKWERVQKKSADKLLVLTHRYKNILIKEGVDKANIIVAPCTVDSNKFLFNRKARKTIRSNLGISENTITGIYVGKFGGIYFENQSIEIFDQAFQFFNDFYLIILTPNTGKVMEEIKDHGLPVKKILVQNVSNDSVPDYLTAADFAFSLHKPIKSAYGYSPVKNAEYWASGLPVIISDGIGDDSELVKEYELGAVMKSTKSTDVMVALRQIHSILQANDYRKTIGEKARFRYTDKHTYNTYLKILKSNMLNAGKAPS